jgi:cell shape-determining protein MreC
MKDLEILENIDLDRILSEFKSRDRKIESLAAENKTQKDELTYTVHAKN